MAADEEALVTLRLSHRLGLERSAHFDVLDAACELADFWRFNTTYMHRLMSEQPISSPGVWNRLEYRPLEGFVFAVTPFNFTAIGGNLPGSAALMGNTVVWKPASTAAYSAHYLMKLFEAAGLPAGYISLARLGVPPSPCKLATHACGRSARRDLTHPPLYRARHRRTGVPSHALETRARRGSRDHRSRRRSAPRR